MDTPGYCLQVTASHPGLQPGVAHDKDPVVAYQRRNPCTQTGVPGGVTPAPTVSSGGDPIQVTCQYSVSDQRTLFWTSSPRTASCPCRQSLRPTTTPARPTQPGHRGSLPRGLQSSPRYPSLAQRQGQMGRAHRDTRGLAPDTLPQHTNTPARLEANRSLHPKATPRDGLRHPSELQQPSPSGADPGSTERGPLPPPSEGRAEALLQQDA